MRLIDADALNEQFEKVKKGCSSLSDIAQIIGVQSVIDNRPTAFDVDKAIAKLEEKTELAYKRYMDCGENTPPSVYARYSAQYQERKMCLDIVKSAINQ
ncbi:hypothetical protein D3Z36_15945 [Lachnospiraceae bacterium]|nr:hypothetical protein [Lachnospiraceae bacterium]